MADEVRRLMTRVRFLTVEQGGRAAPVPPGATYRPLFDIGLRGEDNRPQYVLCQIVAPEGDAIRPGDDRVLPIEVVDGPYTRGLLARGATFALSEGSKIVAEGTIWETATQTMADYIAAHRKAAGPALYLAIIRVSNDRSAPAILRLEPWGMEAPMPPGVAYDILASGPAAKWRPEHAVQIDVADGSTTIWAESVTANLAVFYRGELIYG